VLPTVSYMTFLDVYCVSSIMIVFAAMMWHATYLAIYRQNAEFAERCDTWAMISFAIVVLIVHIAQTIWFFIAIQKRYELEKLDEIAALSYLKTRVSNTVPGGLHHKNPSASATSSMPIVSDHPMSSPPPLPLPPSHQPHQNNHLQPPLATTDPLNNTPSKKQQHTKKNNTDAVLANQLQQQDPVSRQSFSNVKSKRMLYSLSKMEDNSIITVHNSEDYASQNAPRSPPPSHSSPAAQSPRPAQAAAATATPAASYNETCETPLLIGMPTSGGSKLPNSSSYNSSSLSHQQQQHHQNRSHTPTSHGFHAPVTGPSTLPMVNKSGAISKSPSNLLLASKSNSFTNSQGLALTTNNTGGQRDHNNNFQSSSSNANNQNNQNNQNNANLSTTLPHQSHSGGVKQQHRHHHHKVKHKSGGGGSGASQHLYEPANRLSSVAGSASHSLDYQYLPLIHQSSRDS
jgi:hypothetical protein